MIFIGPRIPQAATDYATAAKQDELAQKSPSDLITVKHDEVEIVYLGNGEIDYLSYKLLGVEVARKQMTYTGSDLTQISI